MGLRIEMMDDDEILDRYGSAQVTVIAGYEKLNNEYYPVRGGLYDPRLFGTPYSCTCGHQTTKGRCNKCKDLVVDKSDWLDHLGCFELAVPIVTEQKFSKFKTDMENIFGKIFVKGSADMLYWNTQFKLIPTKDSEKAKFTKDGEMFELQALADNNDSDNINDYGLNAIYNIAKNYNAIHGDLSHLLKCINRYLVISAVPRRMITYFDGEPQYSEGAENYFMIMRINSWLNHIINGTHYKTGVYDKNNKGDILDQCAIARSFSTACNLLYRRYALLRPSKQSELRYSGTTRLDHSGRANIISAEVPMDTALIPPSLAYEALKKDIIDELKTRSVGTRLDYYDRYYHPDKEVMDIFYSLVDKAVVVLNRAPTMHKYNMLAFKMKLWDENDPLNKVENKWKEPCIGINIMVCGPFNADFDGDQMAFYAVSKEPEKSNILRKMGVANNWVYEKNQKSIFIPKDAILIGLYIATKLLPRSNMDNVKSYESLSQMEVAFNNNYINYNTLVLLNGVATSYGIEYISNVIHKDLPKVLASEDQTNFGAEITAKNIDKFCAYIGGLDDKIAIWNQLYQFANRITTRKGVPIIKLSELYNAVPEFPEIKAIMDDPKKSDQEKTKILNAKLKDIVLRGVKDLMPTLYGELMRKGAKIKPDSIIAALAPRISYDQDEKTELVEENFVTGYRESTFTHHAIDTRQVLNQKASQVPDGGWLTRQIEDLLKDYIYIKDSNWTDTVGIEVRRGDAVGRYDLQGNLLGSCSKADAKKLVRIRSCVNHLSKGADQFYIGYDELNQELYKPEDRLAIGSSVGPGSTEMITQAQLGLKHGGSLYLPDETCLTVRKLSEIIPTPVSEYKVKELTKDYIIISAGTKDYKFPLPKNALITSETAEGILHEDDVVYYLKGMHFIDYSINKIGLMFGGDIASALDKDNHNRSKIESVLSVSPYEGTISYGDDSVSIGGSKLKYSNKVVWYYPEGSMIHVGDIINSGVVSPGTLQGINCSYDTKFKLFYTQIKNYGDLSNLQLLFIELLFKSLFSTNSDSIRKAISKQNLFTAITHENGNRIISKSIEKTTFESVTTRLLFNAADNYGLTMKG